MGQPEDYPGPQELGQIREAELYAAAGVLGSQDSDLFHKAEVLCFPTFGLYLVQIEGRRTFGRSGQAVGATPFDSRPDLPNRANGL